MRSFLFVFSMLSMMGGMAHAQNLYVHVEQKVGSDENVTSYAAKGNLGTAVFANTNSPSVEFEDGKAVMTIGDVEVAKLPMSDGGRLVVEHTTSSSTDDLNKVTKSYKANVPFVTIYSPFQLVVPSEGCEVYAPVYDSESGVLRFKAANKLDGGTVVPAETALLVTGHSADVDFSFSTESSADYKLETALSGSSLKIDKPTVDNTTIYTFGFGKNDPYKDKFGLYKFVGSKLGAGVCYLSVASANPASAAKYIAISFDDEVTGISCVESGDEATATGKFVENGSIVIKKAGKKFNLNGQEVM